MFNKEAVTGVGQVKEKDQNNNANNGNKELAHELLEQTQQELTEIKDRYLRALADLANLKKRMAQDRHEARQQGEADVIQDLLPILDNLERAEQAMKKSEDNTDVESLKAGIDLIYNQLRANLKKRGVEPIKAVGEKFDPFYHEAVGRFPTDEVPEGQIVHETQRGYYIGKQVLRASKVMVAMAPEEETEAETDFE